MSWRGRERERGQGLVELAMVLPVLLLLLLGLVEFALVFDASLTLGYGSREGARTGAALAQGGATGCSLPDPGKVDANAMASVQRILKGPGSRLRIADIEEVRIFKATSSGSEAGPVNTWDYAGPSVGPDVDPGLGATRIDFVETTATWPACSRINGGGDPDSIGVTVRYRYRFVTPLASILDFIGGSNASTLVLTETTVMALNPTT